MESVFLHPNMTFADTLSMGTAILGLFLTVPLVSLRKQRDANFFLGMFIFCLSCLSLASTSVYIQYVQIFGVLDWALCCIGPFYYLYVRAVCGADNGHQQLLHFVPVPVFFLALSYQKSIAGAGPLPITIMEYIVIFQLFAVGYAVASLVLLKQYHRRLKQNFSAIQKRDLHWVVWLTMTIIGLIIVWLPGAYGIGMWPWLLLCARLGVLFFVGWYGLKQTHVFVPQLNDSLTKAQHLESSCRHRRDSSTHKYRRSGMNPLITQKIKQGLAIRINEHKDFLENDLKLVDLAENIGTSPQLLSQYLNEELKSNFFQYINLLRVKEARRLLLSADTINESIIDIALRAGFNSKSTFNAAFKKYTGVSPSVWRKEQGSRSEPLWSDECA